MASDDPELKAMDSVFKSLSELSDDQARNRVLDWVFARLGMKSAAKTSPGLPKGGDTAEGNGTSTEIPGVGISPKAFMESKKALNDVERVTCLGYYMTHYQNVERFRASDLEKLNTDAKQSRISNVSMALNNACNNSKYFAQTGKGQKHLTTRGEQLVNALPDRDKVRALPKVGAKRGRKPKPKAKGK